MTGILGTRIMAALAALFNFLALNLALLLFSLPVITRPLAGTTRMSGVTRSASRSSARTRPPSQAPFR